MAQQVHRITEIDDPRIAMYRQLKQQRAGDPSLFVCEGEHLARRLLTSQLKTHSVLLASNRAESLLGELPVGVPAYVAEPQVLSQIVGYAFHRGVLAAGYRPSDATADAVAADARTLVVCPEIHDAENLGSIMRTAAAMGADALLVGHKGADPFGRRAVRVSMGAAFSLPVLRMADLLEQVSKLRDLRGFELLGTVLSEDATPLGRYSRPQRVAIVLGCEPTGLDRGWVAACTQQVTIPMHRATDSLNVAVAAGMILFQLSRGGELCKGR